MGPFKKFVKFARVGKKLALGLTCLVQSLFVVEDSKKSSIYSSMFVRIYLLIFGADHSAFFIYKIFVYTTVVHVTTYHLTYANSYALTKVVYFALKTFRQQEAT